MGMYVCAVCGSGGCMGMFRCVCGVCEEGVYVCVCVCVVLSAKMRVLCVVCCVCCGEVALSISIRD